MHRFEGLMGSALVVNLFGGPGSGKTAMAARIFGELKCMGIEAACPEEHAKLAIWSGRPWLLDHQVIIVGKTWETMVNLCDKVEVIIIDSPILLGSVYAGDREPESFHSLVRDLHMRQPRVNLLVKRDFSRPYDPQNRREDADAAVQIDAKVAAALDLIGEPGEVVGPESGYRTAAREIAALVRAGRGAPAQH